MLSKRPSAFHTFCLYFRFRTNIGGHTNAHAHTLCRGVCQIAIVLLTLILMVDDFKVTLATKFQETMEKRLETRYPQDCNLICNNSFENSVSGVLLTLISMVDDFKVTLATSFQETMEKRLETRCPKDCNLSCNNSFENPAAGGRIKQTFRNIYELTLVGFLEC